MASGWILAIDQGTTNTKALLMDHEGRTAFRASAPLEIMQPQAGYVEQDPLALWQSVRQVTDKCIRYAVSNGGSIAAVAISNQRETTVVWRRNGDPVGNAITWQCRRSAAICKRLREQAPNIHSIAGLPLDPLLSATKWAWVFEQHPELHAQAESGDLLLGTIDSWLLYKITGGRVHATDHTNASRTALLNLSSCDWDETLLNLFDIPRIALPAVRASSSIYGECIAFPSLTGVPIACMIGDSHAALAGHGCYEPGTVKGTYGTGSSLMMLTSALVTETCDLARTVAWTTRNEAHFALEGNIAMSGAAVQWVGEFLGLPHPIEDAAALAATVPDAAGLMLVPAMAGLGAPHWDTAARGVITPIERFHTKAHLARAALDAIAFQIADVLEAMETASGACVPILLTDGGATCNDSLMQMQADILGRPVYRAAQEDLSARGAAMMAGLALGWWKSLVDLAALPKEVRVFEPRMSAAQRNNLRASWNLAVRRARLRNEESGGALC